jgi:hypothetical protein
MSYRVLSTNTWFFSSEWSSRLFMPSIPLMGTFCSICYAKHFILREIMICSCELGFRRQCPSPSQALSVCIPSPSPALTLNRPIINRRPRYIAVSAHLADRPRLFCLFRIPVAFSCEENCSLNNRRHSNPVSSSARPPPMWSP